MQVLKKKATPLTLQPIPQSQSRKKLVLDNSSNPGKQEELRPRRRTSTLHLRTNPSQEKLHKKTSDMLQPSQQPKTQSQGQSVWVSRRGNRNFYLMENQDFIQLDQKTKEYRLYILMDGHGKYGRLLAQTVANRVASKYALDHKSSHKQNLDYSPESIMKNVIAETNKHILSTLPKEVANSGCTLLCVLVQDGQIYCFNVGCSRAVVAVRLGQKQRLVPFPLSTDQNLSRFDQKHRVAQTDAVIEQLKDEHGCRVGPERIWKKGQKYPGVYITRSLGMKLSNQLGIIAEPECTCLRIQPKFQYALLGSDGFWEMFSNEEAIQYLDGFWKQGAVRAGVEGLADQAARRWERKKELMDDISILLIKI